MRFTTLFASSALLTVAAAIPVAQAPSSQTPTPSRPVSTSASTSAAGKVPTPSLAGAYECPPHQQKQCCVTLAQTSHDLMNGLGDLVPILGKIQVSSKLSFQCRDMSPEESPNSCQGNESSPMCCSGGSSNSISSCKPFASAKEDYYRSFGYGQESQIDYIKDAVA